MMIPARASPDPLFAPALARIRLRATKPKTMPRTEPSPTTIPTSEQTSDATAIESLGGRKESPGCPAAEASGANSWNVGLSTDGEPGSHGGGPAAPRSRSGGMPFVWSWSMFV